MNKKGLFNVPMGSYKNPLICDERNLRAVSEKLQNVTIVCGDYKDVADFIDDKTFVYFDPPYFYNGRRLYKNFFTPEYHRIVAQKIFTDVNCDWIVSYDDVPEVLELYSDFPKKHFSLSYSLANKGEGREVMFFKKAQLCPSSEELNEANIKFSVWE